MTSSTSIRVRAFLVAASFACGLVPLHATADGRLEKLEIDTASGPHVMKVEVMRSEDERERGLMFRKFMPEDRGMLFDFKTDQNIDMWMKNTYLPLDMVFIDHTGKIVHIAHNAEPMSERIIPSEAPSVGVLEINAGEANKLNMKVGDTVKHTMFAR